MPPPTPRPPHSKDPVDLEELQRAYNIYHGITLQALIGALHEHFQGIDPDWRLAVIPLPYGATNICVRQLQALLNSGQRTPNNLINVWI